MATLKKLVALCTSLLMTASLVTTAACGGNNEKDSTPPSSSDAPVSSEEISDSETSSDESENSSESGNDSTSEDVGQTHNWGEWVKVSDPSCTEDGVKERVCTEADGTTHKETGKIAALSHNFGNVAVCSRCGETATIPDVPSDTTYIDAVENCKERSRELSLSYDPENPTPDLTLFGDGTDYNCYQLKEGYYEIAIPAAADSNSGAGEIWLSFNASSAGQYALVSTDGNPNDITARRFDHSGFYYNPNDYYEAITTDDGNFLSTVSADEAHWHGGWTATWCLSGEIGDVIKVAFVRIAPPVFTPVTETVNIYATQINGVSAPERTSSEKMISVPYESDYFLEESTGWYRMGTPDNPGSYIYTAITTTPSKLITVDYATAQGTANTLGCVDGYTVDGNYLVKYFGYMLYSHGAIYSPNEDGIFQLSPADPTANSYDNYVNSDGLYPVTQELYEFLNLYVSNKKPFDSSISQEDWENKADWIWLAGCYYYAQMTAGSSDYPLELSAGENVVDLPFADSLFCSYTQDGYYTVACDVEGVTLKIDGTSYASPFNVAFTSSSLISKKFQISSTSGMAIDDVTVTVETATGLSVDTAIALDLEHGVATASLIKVHGTSVSYEGYYKYELNYAGTYTVSSDADAAIMIGTLVLLEGSNEYEYGIENSIYLQDGTAEITVLEGDILIIQITSEIAGDIVLNIGSNS